MPLGVTRETFWTMELLKSAWNQMRQCGGWDQTINRDMMGTRQERRDNGDGVMQCIFDGAGTRATYGFFGVII